MGTVRKHKRYMDVKKTMNITILFILFILDFLSVGTTIDSTLLCFCMGCMVVLSKAFSINKQYGGHRHVRLEMTGEDLSKSDMFKKYFNIGTFSWKLDRYSPLEIFALIEMLIVYSTFVIREQDFQWFDGPFVFIGGFLMYRFLCHNLFRPLELSEKYEGNSEE